MTKEEKRKMMIGRAILNNEILVDKISKWNAHDKILFAMYSVALDEKDVDISMLVAELKRREWLDEIGGVVYLAHLIEYAPLY